MRAPARGARFVALKIFFDGGCCPNPGPITTAVVARGIVHRRVAGHGASHEAEWAALLHALEVATALSVREVVLIGDAADVVAQANGAKCRSPELLAAFRRRAATFDRVRVRHVRRGQNLAGIALDALAAGRGIETAT